MDGKTLKTQLAFLLREATTSAFLDEKTSYDFLYEAACAFAILTQAINGTQVVTTVATTSSYNLNPDFGALRLQSQRNEWLVKYNDGSFDSFIPFRSYEAVLTSNNTDAVDIPNSFSVTDVETASSNITGTANSTSPVASDQATLTSGTTMLGCAVGDTVHNVTDSSSGVIVAVTTTASIQTALFYGTNNYWTTGDSYVIVPQGRKRLVVDPPSATSGHTITIPYVQKPIPVYSDYQSYRFDQMFAPALVKYAAWLAKYRDREPNYGDAWFKYWQTQIAIAVKSTNKAYDRTKFKVNFIRRSLYDRSYR
jgi:hypothetical protein